MFIFDGPNKRIHMDPAFSVNGVFSFSVQQLWSRWVDWQAENKKYPFAFSIIMVPKPDGGFIGPYLFLRNDLGWRGVPPPIDGCTIMITGGSFYGMSGSLPVMENLMGQETNLVIVQADIVNTVSVNGTAGPTAESIAAAVWAYSNRTLTAASSSSLTIEEHNKLMAVPTALENALAHANRVVENNLTNEDLTKLGASVLLGKVTGAGTGTESFRNLDDSKTRVLATVDENGNRTEVSLDAS